MRPAIMLLVLLFAPAAHSESVFPSGCKIWEFAKIGYGYNAYNFLLHGPTLSVLGDDPKGTYLSISAQAMLTMQAAKTFPSEYSGEYVTLSPNQKVRCVVWGTEASVVSKYLSTDLRAEMTKEVQSSMADFLANLKKLNADQKNQRLDELLDAIKNNPDVTKALKEATK